MKRKTASGAAHFSPGGGTDFKPCEEVWLFCPAAFGCTWCSRPISPGDSDCSGVCAGLFRQGSFYFLELFQRKCLVSSTGKAERFTPSCPAGRSYDPGPVLEAASWNASESRAAAASALAYRHFCAFLLRVLLNQNIFL